MKISGFLITMLVVAGVIIAIYNFAGTMSDEQHWNVEINSSFKNTYNKIENLTKHINETQSKIEKVGAERDKNFFTGTWDVFIITKDVILGTGGASIRSIGIGTTLLRDFSNDMELGTSEESSDTGYIYAILYAILSTLVAGALIFLIIKRKW